jgi:hypothetical protein
MEARIWLIHLKNNMNFFQIFIKLY